MEKKEKELVRRIEQMPAAAIYAIADKKHLFTGFDLCARRPVSKLSWSADGLTLNLTLNDGTVCALSPALTESEVSGYCDCGTWSPSGCCPHLVAALATVKKAVSPAAFPMLKLPPEYLEPITRELQGSPLPGEPRPMTARGGAPFMLVVERREGGISFDVRRQGKAVNPWDPGVLPAMRDFLRLLLHAEGRERCLEEFHARFGGRYPIVFQEGERTLPLTLDDCRGRSMVLRLEVRGAELFLSLLLDDGTPFSAESFTYGAYHFDLASGRVERITDTAAAAHYYRLLTLLGTMPQAHLKERAGGFSVAAAAFNRLQLTFSEDATAEFLSRTRIYTEGAPAQVREAQASYRLNITEEGTSVRLAAEGVADGAAFPLSSEAFWFFTAAGRSHFPQPLKAKKRVAAIIATCFELLPARTRGERDRIVRLALDTPDFFKRSVKADARRVINSFTETLSEKRNLVQRSGDEWLLLPVDAEEQARLLQILFGSFGIDLFASGTLPGELTLPRDLLLRHLSRLHRECAAAGFEVTLAGEPLETVSWSFTLDATRSTIDWFELRPEIRHAGELVDDRELEEAVAGGGLFRRNGAIVLLDEESSRALSLFATGGKREVVRVPRLQILDWIVLRKNGVKVLLSPADEQIIESLTNFQSIAPRSVPEGLKAQLRKYQHEGFSWLAFLYEHRFGACLADDMGLGKTVQAIAFLAGLKEGKIAGEAPPAAPHLVVVPPSLIFNWESEIARFYPDFKVCVYRGQGRSADFEGVDLVLTSYGVVQRDIELLSKVPFHVVVFDEAQAVKNIHAGTTGAVRRLKARFKVALTGTPVENHLGEFFSVIDLTVPGLLGPLESFRKGMAHGGAEFVETLVRRTRPFILRRSKDMIAAELPPKVETDIYLEMSPRQKALYVKTVAQVKATVEEAYRSNSPGKARIIALTAILKLRQICLSTRLLLGDGRESAPKVEFLVEQLAELFEEGHSVLVFSQFTSFLDLVGESLVSHGISYARLDGSTPVSERKTIVERFQSSEKPGVFLLSLKAGGRGLNLTRASYVFHLDPWWNPAVENQASDRAHRIGQKRQVTITRLLMRHSIEEKMMELKKRKLKLYRALLDEAPGEGGAAIGREDFEFLLG